MPNAIPPANRKGDFEVYPNPVSGTTVRFTTQVNCRVYSTTGKMVFSGSNLSRLDVRTYKAGLYIIVTDEGIRKKLLIQ
jgi:hypothetical protein